MATRKKQVYLTIYIGPWGLKGVTFELSNKKPDPAHEARGEGNCLVFRLVDGDYSPNFYEALNDGTVMNQIGDFRIHADLDKLLKVTVPKRKLQQTRKIAELKKKGFMS